MRDHINIKCTFTYISIKYSDNCFTMTNKYLALFVKEIRNTNVALFYVVMHASDRCEMRPVLSTGLILFRVMSLHESENKNENERKREKERNRGKGRGR